MEKKVESAILDFIGANYGESKENASYNVELMARAIAKDISK